MYELRVVALSEDARYVVLAPVLEGRRERYRVAVDDRLRAALRGELGRLERKIRPDSALTPREIQARVRAGETAETIAAAAGVAVEWVLRFETPVLAERAQVARQARQASLSVSGGEWTGVPLEEIVAARLEADGSRPDRADWDAWRREDGRWVVQLRVGNFTAHWLWDPALARLVVHDEEARSLLHPDGPGATAAPAPQPRRLTLAAQPPDLEDQDADPTGGAGAAELLQPEVLVELRSETGSPDQPLAGNAEAGSGQQVDLVADLDAVQEPAIATGPEPEGSPEEIADVPTDPPAEADAGTDLPAAGGPEPTRAARRGSRRKSVPSWEDILLGTAAHPGGTGAGGSS